MQFSRISITKKLVSLDWTTTQQDGTLERHEFESKDKPIPSFAGAIMAFSGFALSLIGAPPDWDNGVRVTTLNLKTDKNGKRGLQVSFSRKIDRARGAAVSITTPILWEADNAEGEIADGFYGHVVEELIEAAELEAQKFYKGERVQTEMFAAAEVQPDIAAAGKGRGRGKKPRDFIPGVGPIANADQTEVVTDEVLRQLLLTVDRDVPVDAVARWGSADRDAAQRWARAVVEGLLNRKPVKVEEPECVQRDATLPLSAEDHHNQQPAASV